MPSRLAGLALALSLTVAAPLSAAAQAAPATVITGATLVHPSKSGADALEPDATVVIQDERITYAGSGRAAKMPPGSTVIDGRGKFVIPGLVDSHVHFFQSGNLYTRPDVADFNAVVPYAQEVARKELERVSHSMRLEAQGLPPARERRQLERHVEELLAGNPRRLWD